MASAGLIISRFSEAAGFPHSAVLRIVRGLKEVGLAPREQPGRGRHLGQFTPTHLAEVLLAFAGPQVTDAAEAAQLLRALVYRGSATHADATAAYLIGSTLSEVLARIIVMEAVAQGWVKLEGVPISHLPSYVELCLNPLGAVLTWDFPDGSRRSDLYAPRADISFDPSNVPRLRRGGGVERRSILHPVMLVTAAELWADTARWRPDLTPDLQNTTTGDNAS